MHHRDGHIVNYVLGRAKRQSRAKGGRKEQIAALSPAFVNLTGKRDNKSKKKRIFAVEK